MKFTGTHTHKSLGLFTYEVDYTTRRPGSTWLADWSGTAVGDNRVLQLSGGSMEIIVGSSDAALVFIKKYVAQEIDALT
jgi:hypothetical protein